jgi:hypothetical protein
MYVGYTSLASETYETYYTYAWAPPRHMIPTNGVVTLERNESREIGLLDGRGLTPTHPPRPKVVCQSLVGD